MELSLLIILVQLMVLMLKIIQFIIMKSGTKILPVIILTFMLVMWGKKYNLNSIRQDFILYRLLLFTVHQQYTIS